MAGPESWGPIDGLEFAGGAKIGLRFVLPLLLLGSSLITDGWTQRKTPAKRASSTALSMQSQSQGAISVSFVSAPDGAALNGGASGQRSLNLGTVSRASGAQSANVQVQQFSGHFLVSTRFGLNVQDGSQHATSATILAALAVPDANYTFRLDGVTLETQPQLVQGQARVGSTFMHRLEIDVPASLTEKNSQLHNAIIFQIIPN
ncbi:MAG TPA: hypothetical protein VFT65_16105 [Candidatus Angelobacter sp.]|nr:hypothetical protein [Candidatus Angelobacter sp.]